MRDSAEGPREALEVELDPGGDGFVKGAVGRGHTPPRDLEARNLGGGLGETAAAVRGDALGNTAILGSTESTDFPFSGSLFGGSGAGAKGFVVKLTPSGGRLA